jgi:NADH:ubiquinone reductase (non-electrogenic)
MDRGLRTLPATAQVAKQEGEFLATMFTAANGDVDKLCLGELEPFSYKHKGSLAYIGEDAAVADIPGFAILRGVFAGLVWKSFETWSQVSLRNQALVFADLLRTKIFGRDLSRV